MSSVSIEVIRIADLNGFIDDFQAKRSEGELVPISRARALSQIHNPHAEPSDPGLLVAYHKGRCVGYLGLLPGLLRMDAKDTKIYFSSTAYVPPNLRSTGAGLKLVYHFRVMDLDRVGCDNRPSGERLYRAFKNVRELSPYRIFKIPMSILVDSTHATSCALEGFDWKVISGDEITSELLNEPNPQSTCFYRNAETLQWFLKYQWLSGAEAADPREKDYYFGHFDKRIEYMPVRAFDKAGKGIGFQLFSLVDTREGEERTLKILDNHIDRKLVWPLAIAIARRYQAHSIQVSQDLFTALDTGALFRAVGCFRNRSYFCLPSSDTSPLARAIGRIRLHHCDGDTAFT